VLATATAGPLRLGFGFIRDQVVGLTVVTGDGQVVSAGGRVVKNVAGYDLAKLEIGGFGGFGIITEINLRLRAVPRADLTLVASGARDDLSAAARDIHDAGIGCAALELVSPTLAAESEWLLAARLTGTDGAVEADARRIAAVAARDWTALSSERSAALWALIARGPVGPPVTLRLGVLPEGVDEMLDAVTRDLDEGLVSAGPAGGGLRWSGEIDADRLRTMRRILAAREIPLTLERGPWELRREVGHFGAYREGVGALVSKLREVFDPGQQLSVALEAEA
jgi:FAD/FMN-containing dehydrogenase